MPVETRNASRRSILVVDDDLATSALVKHNLEGAGARVIEAASGLDGIKVLNQTDVDLVLLDIKLPDFNGWGILCLLKMTDALHEIPVIVVSVEPPNAALLASFQPVEYVQKPFDMRDLVARIEKAIDSRRGRPRDAT